MNYFSICTACWTYYFCIRNGVFVDEELAKEMCYALIFITIDIANQTVGI